MPALGTKIPVKDAVFELGTGDEFPCENVVMTGSVELIEVSDNASGGRVERFPCFRDVTVDCDSFWRVQGVELNPGDAVTFKATVIPTDVVFDFPMYVESIQLTGRAKDVWRCKLTLKGTGGTYTFTLPGPGVMRGAGKEAPASTKATAKGPPGDRVPAAAGKP